MNLVEERFGAPDSVAHGLYERIPISAGRRKHPTVSALHLICAAAGKDRDFARDHINTYTKACLLNDGSGYTAQSTSNDYHYAEEQHFGVFYAPRQLAEWQRTEAKKAASVEEALGSSWANYVCAALDIRIDDVLEYFRKPVATALHRQEEQDGDKPKLPNVGEVPEKQVVRGIRSLTIENFKGISSAVTIPLKPITLLFGANSAGKSTVIQAMHYAREILENRNPDPDRTILGGDTINLGGFDNLAHNHDRENVVRISFEIGIDDDGLSHYPLTLASDAGDASGFSEEDMEEAMAREAHLIKVNDVFNVEAVSVQIVCQWSARLQSPIISSYTVGINGRPIATVAILEETGWHAASISYLDWQHPLLKAAEDACESALQEMYDWPDDTSYDPDYGPIEIGAKTPIPEFGKPFRVDDQMYIHDLERFEQFWSLMSQILIRPGEILLEELQDLRYLGPIRQIPPRDYQPPRTPDGARWSNGMAAWDLLYRVDPVPGEDAETQAKRHQGIVERTSKYLSQVLGLGYSIHQDDYVSIDMGGELMAEMQLLANRYEERDASYYIQKILAPLEALPKTSVVKLVDETNDIEVDPHDVGVGVSQALPVVVGAIDPENSVFAVEQPELHVHPAVQCNMGDLFIQEALGDTFIEKGQRKTSRNRIFLLETHSEHLALRIMRRMRETHDGELEGDFPQVTPEDVAVLFVESDASGMRLTELPLDETGEFERNWPTGFFEEREAELF